MIKLCEWHTAILNTFIPDHTVNSDPKSNKLIIPFNVMMSIVNFRKSFVAVENS